MVNFVILSQRECTVGGIGLLPAGEPVMLNEQQLSAFEAVHGYPLKDAQFPSDVEVAVVLLPDENEGGE